MVTEVAGHASAGYVGRPTRLPAARQNKPSKRAKSRQGITRWMKGKLTKQCACGKKVHKAYEFDGRCEDCYSEDQQKYDGKSRNLRLYRTGE